MQTSVPVSDRRHGNRATTRVHAFVHCRGRFQHTQVCNYSPGGMHLSGTFGLHENDVVEVELMSGIRLPGTVAWSLGERSGIAFAEELDDAHPAMVELASAPLAKTS